MATVKLSDSLCHDINNNAERVFTKRIDAYTKNNPVDVSGWGDKIYDTIIPEHLQNKLLSIPKDFIKYKKSISFHGFEDAELHSGGYAYSDLASELKEGKYGSALTLDLSKERPVPTGRNNNGKYDVVCSESYARIDWNDERFIWLRDKIKELNKPLFDIYTERDKFLSDVKALLNAHPTLNKALKQWEGLWDLVPEEAKERHKRVIERYTPEPKEIVDETSDINFDELTAHVQTSKLIDGE
tara:strand:+ start:2158 stop:2883 length:726 start_codon:yes stop_codon:yes gene_type:complete